MMQEPEKMTGHSLDIATDKRARLKQLFPTVFTETVNAKGELTESVDFEKLKAEMGTFTDLFENRREHYGMDWPGKKEALKLIQTTSTATLKPSREESVNFDSTENLFIEGDNLEVLKLLQKSYYGKVKMIYIDPPYNTGNEFIYPDNFSETLDTYLEYAGLIDGEGKRFSTNTANEGRFHTKWLNMMCPRLYLAWNLLQDDGVIFISIDDNEVSNLRKLCDEFFGEENFVAQIIWEKMYTTKNDASQISASHDYILIYAKQNTSNPSIGLLPRTEAMDARYTNIDNDPRGAWKSIPLYADGERKNGRYAITSPSGATFFPPSNAHWRYIQSDVQNLIADNRIWFGRSGDGQPNLKRFLSELNQDGVKAKTLWAHKEVGSNDTASRELKQLFLGSASPFSFPKPTSLLTRIIELGARKDDATILDFFAGSATTAHAVLDLNKQDGGNRKFILVQLPEPCPEESEAVKSGYKTIADIGKERIRRVIKKIEEERATKRKESKGKLPGLTEEEYSLDLGFKVLKLNKSNFKQWQTLPTDTAPEKIIEQLKLHVDHIDPKASPEDLLFEILIKAGFPPSEPIATQTLTGKTVYSVAGGGLLLCLEDEVTAELINAVAEAEPMQFICLDAAFGGNDQLKANAVQTFAARNLGKEKHNQIIFKTV